VANKPDNQQPDREPPDRGEGQEPLEDLENFSIWPPPEPPPDAAPRQDDGGLPWSRRVQKIDDALDEIRRINGGKPESSIPKATEPEIVDEVAAPDLEMSNLDEEMEELKNGIVEDIDQDLDEEIAEALRGESAEAPLELEDAEVLPESVVPTQTTRPEAPPQVASPSRPAPRPQPEPVPPPAATAKPSRTRSAAAPNGEATSQRPSTTTVSALVDLGRRVRERAEGELGQLWANVFFSSEQPPPRTVMVTAARRRDGATQIAVALALVGAESGREHRIALVDFNLRNPGVAGALGLSDSPGLTDVLEGRVPLEVALRNLRLRNGNVLHLLTAGPLVDHPLGLLRSRQTQAMLAQFRDRYEYTIIDVTAANAHPDPQIVGALVDGALLVARAGDTPRETVAEARKRLEHAGVRCLGLVLNQRMHPIPGFVYRAT